MVLEGRGRKGLSVQAVEFLQVLTITSYFSFLVVTSTTCVLHRFTQIAVGSTVVVTQYNATLCRRQDILFVGTSKLNIF